MGSSYVPMGGANYSQWVNNQFNSAEQHRLYNDAIRRAVEQKAKMDKAATVSQEGEFIEGEFTVVTEGGSIANSTGEESSGIQAQRAVEDHSGDTNS